jgi:hypothetical protein
LRRPGEADASLLPRVREHLVTISGADPGGEVLGPGSC